MASSSHLSASRAGMGRTRIVNHESVGLETMVNVNLSSRESMGEEAGE
jgi:hypothetical protein